LFILRVAHVAVIDYDCIIQFPSKMLAACILW